MNPWDRFNARHVGGPCVLLMPSASLRFVKLICLLAPNIKTVSFIVSFYLPPSPLSLSRTMYACVCVCVCVCVFVCLSVSHYLFAFARYFYTFCLYFAYAILVQQRLYVFSCWFFLVKFISRSHSNNVSSHIFAK